MTTVIRINEDLLREVLRVKRNNPQPIPQRECISLIDWYKHIHEESRRIRFANVEKN
jgi:hypothetical protein